MSRKPYPTDLTDTEWAHLQPLLAPPGGDSQEPRDLREILNAVLYVLHGGCGGDLLPHEFPPWQTVDQVIDRWQQDGTWDRLQVAFQQAGLVPARATLPTEGRTDERMPGRPRWPA